MSKSVTSTSVPASWTVLPLKDLGDWSGGGTPSKAKPQYWQGGTIPWVSPKDMKTERISDSEDHITKEAVSHSAASLLNAGSVLIVTRSGILRHTLPVAVTSVAVTVNQDLKSLTPRSGIMAEYVAWALRAFGRDILNTCSKQGTTVNSVETAKLLRYEIPIAPPEQQQRIVAEIEKQFSRLDEAVANLKRVKANLKRYKASVLKAAVEGKLTEDWRKQHPNVEPASKLLERILTERRAKWNGKGKYKEPIVQDSGNLLLLPENWMWASVDQVADVSLGKMLDKQKHRTGRQLSYLRNINVRWGRVNTDDLLEMFFKDTELERYGLLPGDVLVCEGGEPGRAAVWDGRIPELKYQKALHRVRFYGKTEPSYLVFLLEFLANAGRLEHWFTGSTIKHFTRESFVSMPVPLPPIHEQKEIVAEVERRLSVIEELEAAVAANLTRADRLRQSILQKAFNGELVMQFNRTKVAAS